MKVDERSRLGEAGVEFWDFRGQSFILFYFIIIILFKLRKKLLVLIGPPHRP